jgi:hypothetical protein
LETADFFRARLEQMIDPRHPLVILANRMPWRQIEAALAPTFAHKSRAGQAIAEEDLFGPSLEIAGGGVSAAGRPRLPIRWMASLLYLNNKVNNKGLQRDRSHLKFPRSGLLSLESMVLGTSVFTTCRSSLPKACGDMAIYFHLRRRPQFMVQTRPHGQGQVPKGGRDIQCHSR